MQTTRSDIRHAGGSRPDVHIDECWQSGEFYANKVLKEYKGKEQTHVEWVMAVKDLFAKLKVGVHSSGGTKHPQKRSWFGFLCAPSFSVSKENDD